MRQLIREGRFKRDLRRISRRGKSIEKLRAIVVRLQAGEKLNAANRPHFLVGNWRGYSECHIEPDWLLIYRQTDDELRLARTGTHADIFG